MTPPDYRPEVIAQLEEAACVRLEVLPSGAELWESPRTGPFYVDRTITSLKIANGTLMCAGLAAVMRAKRE